VTELTLPHYTAPYAHPVCGMPRFDDPHDPITREARLEEYKTLLARQQQHIEQVSVTSTVTQVQGVGSSLSSWSYTASSTQVQLEVDVGLGLGPSLNEEKDYSSGDRQATEIDVSLERYESQGVSEVPKDESVSLLVSTSLRDRLKLKQMQREKEQQQQQQQQQQKGQEQEQQQKQRQSERSGAGKDLGSPSGIDHVVGLAVGLDSARSTSSLDTHVEHLSLKVPGKTKQKKKPSGDGLVGQPPTPSLASPTLSLGTSVSPSNAASPILGVTRSLSEYSPGTDAAAAGSVMDASAKPKRVMRTPSEAKLPPQKLTLLMSPSIPSTISCHLDDIFPSDSKQQPCEYNRAPAFGLPAIPGLMVWVHSRCSWFLADVDDLDDLDAEAKMEKLRKQWVWPYGFGFVPTPSRVSSNRAMSMAQSYLEQQQQLAMTTDDLTACVQRAFEFSKATQGLCMYSPSVAILMKAADIMCLVHPNPSTPFDPCGVDSPKELLEKDPAKLPLTWGLDPKIEEHLPTPLARYIALAHASCRPEQRIIKYVEYLLEQVKLPSPPALVRQKPIRKKSISPTLGTPLKSNNENGSDDEDENEHDGESDDDDDPYDDDDGQLLLDDEDDSQVTVSYTPAWYYPKVHIILQGVETRVAKRQQLESKAVLGGHPLPAASPNMKLEDRVNCILRAGPAISTSQINSYLFSSWVACGRRFTFQLVETNAQVAQNILALCKAQSSTFTRDETDPFSTLFTITTTELRKLALQAQETSPAPVSQTWIKFLLQFPGLSEKKAVAIAKVYPTIKHLLDDVKKTQQVKKKTMTLAEYTIMNIEVDKRRLGPAIAKQIVNHFISLNGNDRVK